MTCACVKQNNPWLQQLDFMLGRVTKRRLDNYNMMIQAGLIEEAKLFAIRRNADLRKYWQVLVVDQDYIDELKNKDHKLFMADERRYMQGLDKK